MTKLKFLILAVLVVSLGVLAAGCTGEKPIGGEKDAHGCLTGAGYSWCEAKGKCLRVWEEPCTGTSAIDTFGECVAAGYPVMESYPRQCRVPGGPTFTEVISTPMTGALCTAARGHWTECSNTCQLDNAGKPAVACPAMCEALCECGGIAGFGCPEGWTCRMPAGVADALGYCVAETGTGGKLTADQALALAKAGNCTAVGTLSGTPQYNAVTRTWWIDITPAEPKPGCNPACVVDEATRTSEVNWRCTGAMPPLDEKAAASATCTAPGGGQMTLGEALAIASAGDCTEAASLTDRHTCNDVTGTWWIDIEPEQPNAGCNPACVVNITTKTSEINGRCTGLKM
jgi:hypothetical protein